MMHDSRPPVSFARPVLAVSPAFSFVRPTGSNGRVASVRRPVASGAQQFSGKRTVETVLTDYPLISSVKTSSSQAQTMAASRRTSS